MAEEVVNSLVGKVVNSLFGVAKKEISYMSNCTENVEKLGDETEKLTHMRKRFAQKIKEAQDKGDKLLNGVEEWMDKADALTSEAKEIIEGEANAKKFCFNLRMCVNLNTLRHYGKKAEDKLPSLSQHIEDGQPFESGVFVVAPVPGVLDVYQRHNIDELDTQLLAFKQIVESVLDDSIQIIGIYGTGGVGKTTLAKEVAISVRSLFDAVELITVSQTIDLKRIKEEAEVAAKRIINEEKILVILDDVWGKLKLGDVGIPCGVNYMNCKILLTSRSKAVCESMNATRLVSVDSLPTKEAWILFKRVVGDTVETNEKLKKIAENVVEGCGGLPLIIQAVGAALKNESINSWETALTRLQKHTTSYIDPNISLAFTHLKLSYDFLESEEAKSCFLLCSMFPEDSNIPLECLAYYGVGLEIFGDLGSMEDARNGVRHAVKILKSSCLLLDGDNELMAKMHDVVREVALLIASKGNNKFLVNAGKYLTEWQPRNKTLRSCTGISLMQNDIRKLPDYDFQVPLLDIFLLQENCNLSTISDKFIRGVKEARVLDVEHNNITSLPKSLKVLTRLCVLNLGRNRSLDDVSILGELKELEILVLSNTGIRKIPQEFGKLVNLRRLEVKCCHELSNIAPGVISKLRWLEELHIGYHPVKPGSYNSLVELGNLSMLTFLDLFVPYIDLVPEGVDFTRLEGFVIQFSGREEIYLDAGAVHKKSLILSDFDISSLKQARKFIEVSDSIILESVKSNIVPTIYGEGVHDLSTIMLSRCDNLSSLVDSSERQKKLFSKLEHLVLLQLDRFNVMWNCPDDYISLTNLVTINISQCDKLVNLFSVTVARGLVNLKTLCIRQCKCLEEVIWETDEEIGNSDMDIVVEQATNVVFHSLVRVELHDLCMIKKFYRGNSNSIIKYPSLVEVSIYDCHGMDKWGCGTHDTPSLKFVNGIIEHFSIDDGLAKYLKSQLIMTKNGLRTTLLVSSAAFRFFDAIPSIDLKPREPIFSDHVPQVVGLKEWPHTKE